MLNLREIFQECEDRVRATILAEVQQLLQPAKEETLTQWAERMSKTKPTPKVKVARKTTTAQRQKKRTPEELDELRRDFRRVVAAIPGARIEQLAAELGCSTRELALPVKQLIASGAIRTEGQKRATRYWVA